MQDKIDSLRKCLVAHPTDSKLLQMLLQGGIATTVNKGPFAIAKCFLDIPLKDRTHDHHRLRVCFKEFTRRWVCACMYLSVQLLCTIEAVSYTRTMYEVHL